MRRIALILAVLATLLSGGGVARFAHMTIAHGGELGEEYGGEPSGQYGASGCVHAHSHGTSRTPAQAPLHDDCPVCDELATSAPAPSLHSPLIHILAVLAIVHDHEAAQLPAPDAPDDVSARPPPSLA